MGAYEVTELSAVEVPTAVYRAGIPVEVSIEGAPEAIRVRLVDFFAGVAGVSGGRVQVVDRLRFRLIPPAPPTVARAVGRPADARPTLIGTFYA